MFKKRTQKGVSLRKKKNNNVVDLNVFRHFSSAHEDGDFFSLKFPSFSKSDISITQPFLNKRKMDRFRVSRCHFSSVEAYYCIPLGELI